MEQEPPPERGVTRRTMSWLGALLLLAACATPALGAEPVDVGAAAAGAPESGAASPELMPDPLGPVPPDDAKTEAYAHGAYALFFLGTFWSLAVLFAVVASGFGAGLQRVSERVTTRPYLTVSVYAVLFSLLNVMASFPLDLYAGFVREKRYGFLNQDLGGWLGDQAKGLAVGLVLQAILLPVLYWAIRRLGRSWWLPGAALTIVFVVLVQAVFPIFIAPLFNTFEPLRDEALKRDILDLAHAQGIPADQVYQVDASRQSEHNNAYVAGILGTQRIVIYDTLLRRFSPREIRSIMGHEMGHYVLHHIWKSTAFASLLVVIAFLVVDRAGRRIIRKHPGLGIRGLEEPASLPLVLLLLSLLMLPARPIISMYSQAQESAADRFGLDVVKDPEAAASTFLKFGRYDLNESHVHPIIEKILLTHPSIAHRVEAARAWARAHTSQPLPPDVPQPIETPARIRN